MDLVVALPTTPDGFDSVMSMTDKFTKLIALLPGRTNWSGEEWAESVVTYWWTANWGLPTAIISDRDPKFV
ncbi:hypothetical protein N7465_008621 [Penicillium sp. CMV-2018d]|nr:hypothetical protein N7465_008621 [Penicillium sp. CMV-2018d]